MFRALGAVIAMATAPAGAMPDTAPQSAPTRPALTDRQPALTTDVLADGTHWRLWTEHGAIHVWRPQKFRPRSAGTVIYLHGYWNDTDSAWSDHRLVDQFAASRRNALFIVPESPFDDSEGVFWTSLDHLLKRVTHAVKVPLPDGPVVVVGHSGAFRTIVPWLSFKRLDEVILLDGFYNQQEQFLSWLTQVPGHEANRLILVSWETRDRATALCARAPGCATAPRIPDALTELDHQQRNAQLLHIISQYEHMALVTDGKVIPLLLEMSPLKAVRT